MSSIVKGSIAAILSLAKSGDKVQDQPTFTLERSKSSGREDGPTNTS